MTRPLRPVRPPRAVTAAWAVSVLSGAALLAADPTPAPAGTAEPAGAARPSGPAPATTTPAAAEPAALAPGSVAAHLTRAAGPDAREVRANGVYGSGHGGAWQFVAHLSWRDPAGQVTGGTTLLPQQAGQQPIGGTLDPARLRREHDIGWPLADLDIVLDQLPGTTDPLAMLNLEIRPTGDSDLTACHGPAGTEATCHTHDRTGARATTFTDTLTDQPLLDALSVQRASKPAQ